MAEGVACDVDLGMLVWQILLGEVSENVHIDQLQMQSDFIRALTAFDKQVRSCPYLEPLGWRPISCLTHPESKQLAWIP